MTALLANIGGLLGLCLGASVITLIEIVELLLSCCVKLASRLCCDKKGKVEEKRASVTLEANLLLKPINPYAPNVCTIIT